MVSHNQMLDLYVMDEYTLKVLTTSTLYMTITCIKTEPTEH